MEPLATPELSRAVLEDPRERGTKVFSVAVDVKSNDRGTVPIQRLHEDDLAMIFGQTQRIDQPKERLLTSLRIASVCHAWRVLALDTSSLWTAICLCSYSKKSVLLLETLLARSGTQPLDIVVSSTPAEVAPGTFRQTERELFPRMMAALVQHIARWRTVAVDPLFVSSVRDVLAPWQGPAAALQRLTISTVMADSYWRAFAMFCADFRAPNLLSLALHRTRCLPRTDIFEQCFPALEELTIEDQCVPLSHHPWTLMHDLQPLKHLRRLELGGAPVYNSLPAAALPALLFPALEELAFARMFIPSVEDFLAVMEAPVLQTLHLAEIKLVHPHTTFVPVIHAHAERFPALKTVRVTDVSELKDFVWDLTLGAFETLELQFAAQLSVHGTLGFLARRHYAAVNYTAVEIWPLRRLSTLSVVQDGGVSVEDLRQIVGNRAQIQPEAPSAGWRPTPLRGLHIRSRAKLSADDEMWFKENVEEFSWATPSAFEQDDSALGLLKISLHAQ